MQRTGIVGWRFSSQALGLALALLGAGIPLFAVVHTARPHQEWNRSGSPGENETAALPRVDSEAWRHIGWEQSALAPASLGNGGFRSGARHGSGSPWRGVSFGRPGSWSRLPGYPLDLRRQERVSDIHGRNGGRFEFRGHVDEEVLFFVRGHQVTAQTRFGRHMRIERWSLDEPLPIGRPLRIQVSKRDGRGSVQLLEAPHPSNNYTAVIRVYDPRGGSDRYHFRLDWRR